MIHTLTESKLTLEDGVLIKKNSEGAQVASIKLENVDKIDLKEVIDKSIVLLTLLFASSTAAVYFYMPNGWIKVIAIIVLGLLTIIMLCAIKTTVLLIKDRGNIVEFPIADSLEDAQAFFLMVDQQRSNHF